MLIEDDQQLCPGRRSPLGWSWGRREASAVLGGAPRRRENVNRCDETRTCFLLFQGKLIQPDLERNGRQDGSELLKVLGA